MAEKKFESDAKRNERLYVLYYIFGAMFIILLGALAYRQIFMYSYYHKKGMLQTQRRIIQPGARGDIYDRNGRLIVGNRPVFDAVVYFNDARFDFRKEYARLNKLRKQNKEPFDYSKLAIAARTNVLQSYIAEINSILKTDFILDADFNRHFSGRQLMPLPLVKNLSISQHAILAEKLRVDNSAVQIYTDTYRYYPYADRAAHAVGYIRPEIEQVDPDIPGDDLRTFSFLGKIGKSGVEKAFEDRLAGETGAEIWVVDHNGFTFEKIESKPPRKGGSMQVSLDMELQGAIEDAFPNRKGAAVALDVKTGEILAMVSRPSYDPNTFFPTMTHAIYNDIRDRGAWLNRATQGLYPPGSTFKIITALAGIKSGVIGPDTVSYCDGYYQVGSRKFPCHNRYGHGEVNLQQAIEKSCNVFFYEHGQKMGIDSIAKTAKEMGLDSPTGIELHEESTRLTIVPTPEFKRKQGSGWSKGDTANVSIGQGDLRQTPLQMACFAASLARGETRTKPSILHDTTRKTDMKYHGAKKLDIPKSGYDAVIEGMVNAVERGTCRRAAVDGVKIAAKSGTAQVMVKGRKLTLAWMIAFAPVENPEIAAAVIVEGEEPGDASGGATAGPIMREMFAEYFKGRQVAQ